MQQKRDISERAGTKGIFPRDKDQIGPPCLQCGHDHTILVKTGAMEEYRCPKCEMDPAEAEPIEREVKIIRGNR